MLLILITPILAVRDEIRPFSVAYAFEP